MRILIYGLRVISVPLYLLMTLFEWVGLFLCSISGVIFNIISFLIFLLALLSGLLNANSAASIREMLIISFALFLIPQIGMKITVMIIYAKNKLLIFAFPNRN